MFFGVKCVSIILGHGTYQSGPEDGGATVRGQWVHTISPHQTVFHQKQVKEAVLVNADPLSSMPFNTVIFH
jgi:hypothetical protein